MSRWRSNATWRGPNATWCARFTLFLGVLDPLSWSHVALEAQRDMAEAQYDVARSFCSFLGSFGALEAEPRRVGGPTRHGGGQCDVARSFGSLLGSFAALEAEPRRVGGPTRHGSLPIRRGGAHHNLAPPFSGYFNKKSHLRTKSEVAGLMLIWFLVCLTCQLGH